MPDKLNGIGTAADFRELAEKSSWAEAERVVLPGSGLAVMIRRPTLMYFRMRRSLWPAELVEKIENQAVGGKLADLTSEEKLLLIREDVKLFEGAFVVPRLTLHPGPEEISPHWLKPQDVEFLKRYLGGEVLADGTDLNTFRGTQPAAAADGGGDGGDVRQDAGGVADPPAGNVVH